MSRSLLGLVSSYLLCGMLVCCCGCKEKETTAVAPEKGTEAAEHKHDHDHDAPEDLAGGVAMLKEHYQEIKTAFEADDSEAAHAPLHCVGDLLKALPTLAKSAELAEDQVAAVQTASDKMFEAYGKIDGAMHHGETPDYAAVSDSLDENMAALEKAVPTAPEK